MRRSLRRSSFSTNEKHLHLAPHERPGAFAVSLYPRDDDCSSTTSSEFESDASFSSNIAAGEVRNEGTDRTPTSRDLGIPEARQVDEDRELDLLQLMDARARRIDELQQQVKALENQKPLVEAVAVDPYESLQQDDDLQRLYESLQMAHFITSRKDIEWQVARPKKRPTEVICFRRYQ